MKDITVIIPIIDVDNKELLMRAINSVEMQNPDRVLLVFPSIIAKEVKKLNLPSFIELLPNTGGILFSEQINFAVEKVDTKYFTVLEFDDEYSKVYSKNIEKFMLEYQDVSMYLPIIVETKDDAFVKLTNEFLWSKQFIENDDFGFLTNKLLHEFTYFYLSGSIINTLDFKEVGGLKVKFDVTCVYEFLLRLTFNGKKVFVIPKIGYLHTSDRDGSATKQFASKYTKGDIEEQYKLAKKEYMFN